jgi:hypothetical protein
MGLYRRVLGVAILFAAIGCDKPGGSGDGAPGWELKPPTADAEAVTAKERMPGLYPAGSRIKDREALGGFGPCDNYPKDLGGNEWGAAGAVSLVAFTDEAVAYFKYRGFALRLVNRTGEAVPFAACDSMLTLVREARDADGAWREVETPPQPICGNSDHRVFLGPGQYWEFPAREYAGPVTTRLRFRLDPGSGRAVIYSNEFDGRVTAAQFEGAK